MKIKFLCAVAALATAASFSQTAFADDAAPAAAAPTPAFTITGDAALVSQYRFRGVSQSDNKPTGQLSLTITHKSGFYISTWASGNQLAGGSEIDVSGGYSKTIAGYTLDGGLYSYIYPNHRAYFSLPNGPGTDTYEVYGDVSKSYGPITAKVGVNWAPKQHVFSYAGAAHHYSVYEYANLSYTPTKLPALTLHAELGHTGGGFDYANAAPPKEYIDYTVGVGYKWKLLTFDISAVGTNLSHADAGTSQYGYREVKLAPVFSITANFP